MIAEDLEGVSRLAISLKDEVYIQADPDCLSRVYIDV